MSDLPTLLLVQVDAAYASDAANALELSTSAT